MGYKKVDKNVARKRKHRSVRKKVYGTSERPRLVVFKSNKNIYAQLIDDESNKTLTGISSLSISLKGEMDSAESRVARASILGKVIANKASELKIKKIVFDRSGYIYHGVVKAIADGAREGGLKF